MDKGKLKGHAALWVANLVWGLNAPIGKSVLWSEHNPGGVSPFALSVYRMLGACLLFWSVSLFLPRERVARRDIVLLLFASVFGIQLNQMLFLWGLSLTSPIDSSIIATVVPVLTMVLATLFLREPITWLKAGGVFLGCAARRQPRRACQPYVPSDVDRGNRPYFRSSLHPSTTSALFGKTHSGIRYDPILDQPPPRMLRRMRFLHHIGPSGQIHRFPFARIHCQGSREGHRDARLQGVYLRPRRPVGQHVCHGRLQS